MRVIFKLVLFLAVLCSGTSLYAQYADTSALSGSVILTMKGRRVFADGEKISRKDAAIYFADYQGTDQSDLWEKHRKAFNLGRGLQAGGVTLGLVSTVGFTVGVTGVLSHGIAAAFSGDTTHVEKYGTLTSVSLYSLIGGGVLVVSGVTVKIINKRRMQKMVQAYNDERTMPDLTMRVGGQANGFGISLVF